MPDIAAEERRAANPVAVEVVRGDEVESLHRAACAVADSRGRAVRRWGDVDCPVYPRSAVKPIQALPLVETGAAERFAVSDAELAIACASHGGEPGHVAVVADWLARLGLGESDLECGAHLPMHGPSAEAVIRAGGTPTALHNNCSGKHAGMLATARHLGEPAKGYIRGDHPVQRRVSHTIGEMAGVDVGRAPVAADGCGIPTIGLPLIALATAMARFADPSGLAPERRAAVLRVRGAMAAKPHMVAGTGRFCTAVIESSKGAILAKSGSEGVYTVALPDLGLGVALKADDGAKRASRVAVAAVLRRLGALDDALAERLADFVVMPLFNPAGRRAGEVRPAAGWPP